MNKKSKAVFTLTHNEKVFLPIWMRYYSKYFDGDDIYVIDHDTTDGSVENLKKDFKFHHHVEHNPTFSDNDFMTGTIKKWQAELLKDYEYVLYSDADELVVADPLSYSGIDEYIDKTDVEFIACLSRSICQHPDEPPIDLNNLPLLKQRNWWFEEELWNKVLLAKVPLDWSKGLHFIPQELWDKLVIDQELLLIHLHRLDYDVVVEKRHSFDNEKWGGKNNESFQHRLRGEELKKWFFNPPTNDPEKKNHLVMPIPDRFKELI